MICYELYQKQRELTKVTHKDVMYYYSMKSSKKCSEYVSEH